MVLNRLITSILCLGLLNGVFAQKGKLGVKTVSVTNVKVNEFTALTSSVAANATLLNVTANGLNANARFTSTLTPGDLVMIIQMQGAKMNLGTYAVPWQPDSTYGKIYDYSSCGNYEFAEVKSTISTNQIELTCGLTHSYSSTGKTQIVRVPRYSGLNITGAGVLTTDAWNGTIGGILAVEVDGLTTIDGTVTATGLGFRGGAAVGNGGTGNTNFVTKNPSDGAEKGEGIGSDRLLKAAATTTATPDSLGYQCKGAPANGGGGGNANNCGGGGGANGGNINGWYGYGITNTTYSVAFNLEWPTRSTLVSSGGGKGGYGTSTVSTNNPNTVGPNNISWGTQRRPSYGGFGGRPLDYSLGKIFMGGGGGSGHMSSGQSNGSNACSGGAGGGLIYFLTYGAISGTGNISSNGANGNNAFGGSTFSNPQQGIDGAGGAGAGGTIILKSNGTISSITANTNGGNGGNQIKSGTSNSEGQGPGGGGSGGYIAASNVGFTQNTNGGSNGTTNASAFDTEFPMNGATSGDAGTKNQVIAPSYSLTASSNQTICTNQSATLTASSTNTAATIEWYNTLSTAAVNNGTVYVTPTYTTTGTYTVYAGSCPGLYRLPIIITVTNGPTFSINSPTICSGQSTILTVTTSATSYTWNAAGSPTTNTLSVSPTSTTIYTINGSSSSCVGSHTTQVIVNNIPTVSVPNATICTGTSTVLTVSGTATSFTWMPGSIISSTISSNSNTTYTITGSNSTCTNSAMATVTVIALPNVSVPNATICSGTSTVLAASGTASSFTWMPGSITTSTISANAAANYTITGSNGTCTNSTTASVNVTPTPTLTANSVTICAGQVATFTASGAASYTWNPGGVTGTFTISPASSGTVSVTGVNGSCSTQITRSVTVTPNPTVAVSSQTICPTQTVVLTASGATTYSWNTGPTTNTISVSPSSLTVYTVTGTSSLCINTQTVSVTVDSQPTVAVANASICSGNSTTLTASGTTNYTWMPGGQTTSTVSVSPGSTTIYTITGSNGTCSATTTATVNVTSTPTLVANSVTICPAQTATLTVSGATTYTWNPGNVAGSSYTISPASDATVSLTGAIGSCLSSTTLSVTIGTGISISVNNPTICAGETASLTANGATSYTWDTGANTNTLNVSPVLTTTYTILGTSGTCSGSNTAVVTVNSVPSITVTSTSICPGQSATLTASGATNYTWMPGGQLTLSITDNPSTTTIYTVTGANGTCTNTANGTISVTPTPTLVVNSPTICAGQAATLTAGGATSYTWNPGNLTGTSVTVTPVINTTYTITGVDAACTGSVTSEVTVTNCNNICSFDLGNDTSFCSPMNYTINGPSGFTSYSWTPGGAITQNITAINTGTYVCTATVLSNDLVANGDFSLGNTMFTSNYVVPVTPGPFGLLSNPGTYIITTDPNAGHVNFVTFGDHTTGTGNMMVCNGSAVANDIVWSETITVSPNTNYNFSAWVASVYNTSAGNEAQLQFSINGGLLGTTYSAPFTAGVWGNFSTNWNSGANTSAIITIVDQNFTAPGANDFALDDIFYQQVCSYSDTVIVTENPAPSLTPTASSSMICLGNSTSLTASGGVGTYTWTNGVNNGIAFSPTVTATYTVTGTSAAGCTNTAVQTITVNSPPTISVNNPSLSICSGQTVTIVASGASTYTWTGSVTSASLTASPSTTTVYAVSGTDVNGCTGNSTSTVNVTATPTISVLPATICAGQSATLTAVGSASSYLWSTTETTGTINPSPVNTSTYSVVGSNSNCNSSPLTTTVTVSPSPTLSVNALNTIGCAPLCVNFSDITSSSCSTISYNYGDGTTGNTNNPTYCYNAGGNYSVTATCTNTLGCSSTYTLPSVIQVNLTPVADFNLQEGNTVFVGTTVHFSNVSTNANTFAWSLCDGNVSSLTDVNMTYADTGNCCISLLASNSTCTNSVTKCIAIVREAVVVIPNVFTPNGDASNELFKIPSSGLKTLNCVIYDRWGLKMHEWDGLNGYWDGNAKSGVAPAGTYFYIINYTDQLDQTKTEKGFLNLFRD
ncbi:MAG: hypothetical protein K0S26_2453 [Bacteroidota bacterium]|nr:hypothetical protein [Bacteroidota bacterium]